MDMRTRHSLHRAGALALVIALVIVPGLSLTPAGVAAEDRATAVISLAPGTTFQTITAWEATAWMGQDTSPNLANYSADVMAMAVDELGLNRLRVELRAGVENPEDYWTQYQEGVVDYDFWRTHRYTTVNDDADPDNINWSGFQFSELDNTVETVVLPFIERVRARGDIPLINLNYVAFTAQNGAGTQYIHDDPDEYAELMLATFIHLQSNYSLVPDYIEVILEPDNVAQWNGHTIGNAMVATRTKLLRGGFTPRFIAPSNSNMGTAVTYFDQMLTVTGSLLALDELAYHRYGGVSDSNLRAIDQRRATYHIDTAMLEHIGSGHEDLYKDLTMANCSSWQQFALAGLGTSDTGGAYLLVDETDPSDPVVTMATRTKMLSQYFAYVRPGAVRIQATTTDAAFSPVAFLNDGTTYAVVVKASAAGVFTVEDLPAGTYGITYSTSSAYSVDLPDVTIGLGGTVSVSMPAAGVATVYELRRAPAIVVFPAEPQVDLSEGMTQNFIVTPEGGRDGLAFEWTLDGALEEDWNETTYAYEATYDSSGEHVLGLVVRDVADPTLYTTFSWYITVTDVNRLPTILDRTPDPLWVVNETAEGSVLFSVSAVDEDGDDLSYIWYADSREVLRGDYATYTYEYDFSSAGDHVITVTVSDGVGTRTATWTLRVLNVDRPPVVLSRDPGEEVTVDETSYGSLYLYVEAWDPDGDSITYQWYLNDDLVYNERRAYYYFRYDFNSAGAHRVRVAITSSGTEISVGWLVTVVDVNVPPTISYATPSYNPYQYEQEDANLTFSVTASDPEGEDLSYSWEVDGIAVPGATESSFVYGYGYDSQGQHLINVTVSDGEDATTHSWTLTVYNVNRAPTVGGASPLTDRNISGSKPLRLEVFASDPDGDDLYYQWYLNGSVVGGATGPSFQFEPEEAFGNYTFYVLVYDGEGGYAGHTWNISVDPTLDDVPPWEFPWWGYLVVGVVFVAAFMGLLLWAMGKESRKRQVS